MRRGPTVNRTVPCNQGGEVSRRLDFITILGGVRMDDYTRKFSIVDDKDVEIYNILTTVYQALEEKGYNPINQIVGYILSEDPTYITNHMGARTLIRKLDRDELLQVLVKKYLGQ